LQTLDDESVGAELFVQVSVKLMPPRSDSPLIGARRSAWRDSSGWGAHSRRVDNRDQMADRDLPQ
jgi:hypothetical protein